MADLLDSVGHLPKRGTRVFNLDDLRLVLNPPPGLEAAHILDVILVVVVAGSTAVCRGKIMAKIVVQVVAAVLLWDLTDRDQVHLPVAR
jgi:hypothetical protein